METGYLISFLKFLSQEKRYSANTITSYRNDLNQLVLFFDEAEINFLTCTTRDLRNWILKLSSDNLSSSTINRKIASVKSFFKYLRKEGVKGENPSTGLKALKKSKKIPEFIHSKDLTNLLDKIEFDFEDFTDLRSYLIITLLYSTGMRRAELINLKVSDIDFSQKSLKLTGKGNKQRIIPLSEQTLEVIENYLEKKRNILNSSGYLIVTNNGKKSYPGLVYQTVKKYLGMVTSQKKRSPHVLRHSFATHLLDKGADLNAIKELLGHSNLAATQIYTHSSLEKLKETFTQAHPKS